MTIKVTRSALQKAASIAGLLLTTDPPPQCYGATRALVTEIPEKEKNPSDASRRHGRHGLLSRMTE